MRASLCTDAHGSLIVDFLRDYKMLKPDVEKQMKDRPVQQSRDLQKRYKIGVGRVVQKVVSGKQELYNLLDEFDDDDDVDAVLNSDLLLERQEERDVLRAILNEM